jgi:hypothetical protein
MSTGLTTIECIRDFLTIVQDTFLDFGEVKATECSKYHQAKQWWDPDRSDQDSDDPEVVRLWFRGEFEGWKRGESSYPEPTLLRSPKPSFNPGCFLQTLSTPRAWFAIEQSVQAMLRSRGAPIVESREGFAAHTQLDWTFVAQHHGFPTRLLDWSASALTALYFATVDPNTYAITDINKGRAAESDGIVWILEPRILLCRQERSDDTHVRASYYGDKSILHEFFLGEGETYPRMSDSRHSKINEPAIAHFLCEHQGIECPPGLETCKNDMRSSPDRDCTLISSFKNTPTVPKLQRFHPIPITPAHHLDRVLTQQSRFTLHPFRGQALNVQGDRSKTEDYLRKFRIPANRRQPIASALRRLGVNAFSLFPDLDHLSVYYKDMRRRYGHQ